MAEHKLQVKRTSRLEDGGCNFCTSHSYFKVWRVRGTDECCTLEVRFCQSCRDAFVKQSKR